LPDLRGRSPMHTGNGPGLTPLRLGEKVGVDNVTVSTSQMPSHNHVLNPPTAFSTSTTNAGGGQSHPNNKPGLGINFNISLTGLFPSRSSGAAADIEPLRSEPFVADINMFAGNFAPRGTASTDGQLLAISQNQALFSLVGTIYGGDGRTTFGLPDLRGSLPIHEGLGPGLSDYRLGQRGGVEDVALGVTQLPSHDHPSDNPVLPTGGSQLHTNIQPYETVNYIVATQGVYPSRSSDLSDIETNGADPFIGEVRMFAGNFAPRGWAFADGQLLPISPNLALFSLLGTIYGGDGRTTFALPELRGRVPVHPGSGPGLRTWRLGETYGVENVTLSVSEMPSHTHNYTIPEPSTLLLTLASCAGLGMRRLRA
jgi:microcystin-dependent protein